jgi:hypothetical protein
VTTINGVKTIFIGAGSFLERIDKSRMGDCCDVTNGADRCQRSVVL